MTPAQKAVLAISAYIGIGTIVTVWTVIKQQKDEASFDGLGSTTSVSMILIQNVLLWPYAATVNLTKQATKT